MIGLEGLPARAEADDVEPAAGNDLEEIIAWDLVRVFTEKAPEIDLVKLGLAIADLGHQREASRTSS